MNNPILKISNATFGYDKKVVIDNFNLEINSGEKFLLVGPNGTGKSTILKSILKIIPLIKGNLIANCKISYCKQDYQEINFPITVEEVVSMGLYNKKIPHKDKNQLIDQSLNKTDSFHLKKRLFNTLSGGERQRVSLSRCFCQESDLILLDEPSSFMDKDSLISLINLLKSNIFDNIAVIVVTHDESIIQSLNWKKIVLKEKDYV